MATHTKQKVVWLYSHLLFLTGGTRFVLEVTKRLQEFYDVKIIVEKASPEIREQITGNGVEIKEVGFSTSASLIYWLLLPLMLWLEGKRIKNEIEDADVVISGMFPMNVIAARLEKPTIQNCWEPFAFFYDENMINGFNLPRRTLIRVLAALYGRIDIAGTKKSDVIITLNQSTSEWIRKVYRRDAVKSYMGVDADFFKPVQVSLLKRSGEKIILHSTDYTLMKGTEYLIDALPLIIEVIEDVKVIITHTVENVRERGRLLNKAKGLGVDRFIEFVGTVPYSKLPEYYSSADVVAFTGHPEGIGATASLTVLEAMACEAPVVRSIGCREEVEDGISGLLVDPRDRNKLAAAIAKILLNKDLAKNMGKEGRRRVSALYNWDNTCDVFSGAVRSLIGPKVPG